MSNNDDNNLINFSYIKSIFNTVKKDFIEDVKENYNFIKDTYNDLKTQRDNIHKERIEVIKRNFFKNKKILTGDINDSKNIDEYYNDLLNFMINDKLIEQQKYINDSNIERITHDEYKENVSINRMTCELLEKSTIKNNVCCLCQDNIVNGDICCITKCNHIYHDRCAKEWFIKSCIKPNCVLCQKNILNITL